MNCFDHAPEKIPAVAVCSRCGAALCEEHAVVTRDHIYRTATINRRVAVEPPARLVRCQTCAAATAALAAAR